MPIFLLLLAWLFGLPAVLHSQQLYYKSFTAENGLPSSEVYQVYEDRKGFLWMCTDRGLVRYDGLNFVYYSISNGLQDNTVFKVWEDNQGLIWILTMYGGLCYYDHNVQQWTRHPANEQILQLLRSFRILGLERDRQGNLWFSAAGNPTENINIYSIPKGRDSIVVHPLASKRSNAQSQLLVEIDSGIYLPVGMEHMMRLEIENPTILWEQDTLNGWPVIVQGEQGNCTCQRLRGGQWLCLQRRQVSRYDQAKGYVSSSQIPDSVGNIVGAHEDQAGNIWLATRRGLLCYPKGLLNQAPLCQFPDMSITNIFEDSEQNKWISTMGEGVLFVPPLNVQTYRFNYPDAINRKIVRFLEWGDSLLAVNHAGKIFALRSDSFELVFTPPFDRNAQVTEDAIWLDANTIYLSNGLVWDVQGKKPLDKLLPANNISSKRVAKVGQTLIMGYSNGVFLRKPQGQWYNPHLESRVEAIAVQDEQTVLLGTQKGLLRYHLQHDRFESLYPQYSYRIHDLLWHKGYLLMGTGGGGLLIGKGEQVLQIGSKEGLSSDFIYCIFIESDSLLWLGTNQGITRILHWQKSPSQMQLERYNFSSGLPSNSIRDIKRRGDWIWIANEKGVFKLQVSEPKQGRRTRPAFITQLKINGSFLALDSLLQLKAYQNNIEIGFAAVRLRDAHNLSFEYRLEGKDQDWQITRQRSIQYTNLAAGEYTFWLRVVGEDQSKATKIKIIIEPHLTDRWWFRALVFLILLAVLWYYFQQWRLRNQMALQQAQSEQYALRSQMNPHFLFNALNSILYFIHLNDKKGASQYLTKFAKLLRRSLESTQQEFIPLTQELENLQDYMDIERQRLGGTEQEHDFRVEVSPQVKLNQHQIPTMILQPLIENAIVHGLSPKMGARHLWVEVQEVEGQLKISILDNGIGRAAAQERKQRSQHRHQSFGLENIQKRLSVLNYLHKRKMKLEISDLFDEQGQATGTRADFWLG
jgi:ligand-binding sensor domain-containing protein/anti-sigma regulatory factor (Ser/Thr protein kinase)